MKHRLIWNLTISYIVIFFASFLLLNTVGKHSLYEKHINERISILYQEAQSMNNEFLEGYYNNLYSVDDMLIQLKLIDKFLDTRVLALGPNGKIIVDSTLGYNPDTSITIGNDFLSKMHTKNETLNGLFPEPMLSVIYPISSDLELKGYLVLNYPMAKINRNTNHDLRIIHISIISIGIILFLSYICIIILILRPLREIRKGIKAFIDGNFDYKINLHRHNEFYTLANSINYMGQQLASLDDYQKNFIANISHDFRSPLTSIKGYAEAMKDGTIPVEMQSKYLDIILFESERLTKLTSNLLTLNNMQYNGSFLSIGVFDINRILKKTAEVFEGICTKKKITIELNFIADKTNVCGDVDKIQQVLYNLLDNAIKFSNNNSTIEMTVTERIDKVYVAIKDHGVGIPSDSIYKIWDRFYKTDPSRGKDKKGTGLGLAIVKEIINAHGETITVVSTVNVGTEFVFTLSIPEEE